jgi:hypothetical protein
MSDKAVRSQIHVRGACTIANVPPLRTDRICATLCGTNRGYTKGHSPVALQTGLPNVKWSGCEQKEEKS